MKDFVFNVLVLMGRLFMASLLVLTLIIATLLYPLAAVAEYIDRRAHERSLRAKKEYID